MNAIQIHGADTNKDSIKWEPFRGNLFMVWIVRLSGVVSFVSTSNVDNPIAASDWNILKNGLFTTAFTFRINKYQGAELLDIPSNGILFKYHSTFNTMSN